MSVQNYNSTKFFIKKLLAKEMRKTKILMNTLVSFGSSISDLKKIVIILL